MKLSIFIILIPIPDFPHFYYMLGGNLGSLLYGDVSVMVSDKTINYEQTYHSRFIGVRLLCHPHSSDRNDGNQHDVQPIHGRDGDDARSGDEGRYDAPADVYADASLWGSRRRPRILACRTRRHHAVLLHA